MASSEKELEQRFSKYYEDMYSNLKEFIIEFYARQLNSYYKLSLLNGVDTLLQKVNSIGDVFNVSCDFFSVRNEVEQLLREEYHLVIVNDNPLEIETIKKD